MAPPFVIGSPTQHGTIHQLRISPLNRGGSFAEVIIDRHCPQRHPTAIGERLHGTVAAETAAILKERMLFARTMFGRASEAPSWRTGPN